MMAVAGPGGAVAGYPRWLEKWWLDQAALKAGPGLSRWEAVVSRLGDMLTIDRADRLGAYAGDPALWLAYGLFHFPRTFTAIQFALAELDTFRIPGRLRRDDLQVLDLGAGTGAAALGLAAWRESAAGGGRLSVTLADTSAPARDLFGQLAGAAAEIWPRTSFQWRKGDLLSGKVAASTRPWDMMTACFSLNEAFQGETDERVASWAAVMGRRLAPDGVLLRAEPALREAAERLERLRDRVAADASLGMRILAPCRHERACPLLAGGNAWCHEVRRWGPPASLQQLNRRLFRETDVLKFSFLALSPTPAAGGGKTGTFRLVSPVSRTKGRYLMSGCAGDGEKVSVDVLEKGLAQDTRAGLAFLERGDVLTVRDGCRSGKGVRLREWADVEVVEAVRPASGKKAEKA